MRAREKNEEEPKKRSIRNAAFCNAMPSEPKSMPKREKALPQRKERRWVKKGTLQLQKKIQTLQSRRMRAINSTWSALST